MLVDRCESDAALICRNVDIGVTITERAMVKLLRNPAVSMGFPARACLTKLWVLVVPSVDSPDVNLKETGYFFVGQTK